MSLDDVIEFLTATIGSMSSYNFSIELLRRPKSHRLHAPILRSQSIPASAFSLYSTGPGGISCTVVSIQCVSIDQDRPVFYQCEAFTEHITLASEFQRLIQIHKWSFQKYSTTISALRTFQSVLKTKILTTP